MKENKKNNHAVRVGHFPNSVEDHRNTRETVRFCVEHKNKFRTSF